MIDIAEPNFASPPRRPAPQCGAYSLGDGARVHIRPMRLVELKCLPRLFTQLSAQSRYQRFLVAKRSLDPATIENLARAVMDPRSAVLVAVARHLTRDEIIGGARVVPCARPGTGEFAITIVDSWQGKGVGTVLLRAILRAARRVGYHHIDGWILPTNAAMLAAAKRTGFRVLAGSRDGNVLRVTRNLHRAIPPEALTRPACAGPEQPPAGDCWLRRRTVRTVVDAATADSTAFQ